MPATAAAAATIPTIVAANVPLKVGSRVCLRFVPEVHDVRANGARLMAAVLLFFKMKKGKK